MAGGLTISTLNDSSGVLATQNGMKGIAKAWIYWTGTTSPVVQNSFNISSITRTATGKFTITFTTAMPNANYCVATGSCLTTASSNGLVMAFNSPSSTSPQSTTSINVATSGNGALYTFEDPYFASLTIFGS